MAWKQNYYDSAIAAGIPASTAAHIASSNNPGRAFSHALSVHGDAANQTKARQAPPPPSAPDPIAAPEAVLLRPDTETGVKRKRSRRERLGLTNRGVSQFSFSPSAGLGGFGQGGSGGGLGI